MATTCTASGVWDVIADAAFLSKQQFQAGTLLILCQMITDAGGEPDMITCTVAGLWDTIKGSPGFISDQQFYATNLSLLCQLAEASAAGGTNPLLWATAPTSLSDFPASEPAPADITKVWDRKFRDGTPSIRWDPVAGAWG